MAMPAAPLKDLPLENVPEDPVAKAKQLAACKAIDEYVRDGGKLGIGSGSTVVYAISRLAQRVKAEGWNVLCVPTSFQSRQLLIENGLPLTDLSITPELDVCIDGADEIDEWLNAIKGGGGCQLQEKIVAACAEKFVIIADYTKDSDRLGKKWLKGVPIEVSPMAYVPISLRLQKMGGAAFKTTEMGQPVLRMAKSKAGPCVTDNGNLILDTHFGVMEDPVALEKEIMMIPGVVEVGIFSTMAEKAFLGMQDGSVKVVLPTSK